jgi:hypothetical protein
LRIDWAIPCRYAEVNDNLATIVGAGIDNIYAPTLPAPVRVVIATRFVAPLDELGEDNQHAVSCVARDAALNEVGEVSGTLAVPVPEGAREEWLLGIHMPLAVQFEAAVEGTYTLEIKVDEDAQQLPLHVGNVPPPPAG